MNTPRRDAKSGSEISPNVQGSTNWGMCREQHHTITDKTNILLSGLLLCRWSGPKSGRTTASETRKDNDEGEDDVMRDYWIIREIIRQRVAPKRTCSVVVVGVKVGLVAENINIPDDEPGQSKQGDQIAAEGRCGFGIILLLRRFVASTPVVDVSTAALGKRQENTDDASHNQVNRNHPFQRTVIEVLGSWKKNLVVQSYASIRQKWRR